MKKPLSHSVFKTRPARLLRSSASTHALTAIVSGVVVVSLVANIPALAASLVGDLNGDGTVNALDLSILLSNWGKTTATPTATPKATPTPTATATADPTNGGGALEPLGVAGNWTLKFDDEFNGTSLNTSNWAAMNTSMNNVQTSPNNVAVSGGNLILTLASSSSGAEVCTCNSGNKYALPVGGYTEARVYFPGNGTSIYNWPAWWTSGPNWPAAGENDIAEGLGTLTDNYHSPSGSHNQGTVPGVWSNGFHVYGMYRLSNKVEIFYDGKLVRTYSTDDNGQGESLIVNVGSGNTGAYGTASQVKVDYVRAWQ